MKYYVSSTLRLQGTADAILLSRTPHRQEVASQLPVLFLFTGWAKNSKLEGEIQRLKDLYNIFYREWFDCICNPTA